MNRKNIVIILLLSALPIILASVLEVEEAYRREVSNFVVSDFRAEELRFRAGGFEIDIDTNREISYEGEIADPELREKLWNIITEQRKQPKIEGGNYSGGTPYLVLHASNGADFTLSYTWDREEEGVDDYGEPVISPAGRAFVITGTRSEKYQATTEEEFGKLIMDYLRANAVPEDQAKDTGTAQVISKERLWQKSAETDSIVFVDCYQNWAWGYQCYGSFIDCHGNLYSFDYSKQEWMREEEFRDALWETYCDTEPVRREVCESKELLDIQLEDFYAIDRTAKWSSEIVACDMGQRTLYVCDPAFEMIELRSMGDVEQELQDKTAKKLCRFYDGIVWK